MAAFRLAERFREAVDEYGSEAKVPARTAAASMIEAAARWLNVTHPELTHWVRAASRAHRRIQGNVSTVYAVDCWFLSGTMHIEEQELR